jgi:hypothetical protein
MTMTLEFYDPAFDHWSETLPDDTWLKSTLRRTKMSLNELLWTVKPDLPQVGDTPDLRQLRAIARRSNAAATPSNPAGPRVLIFSMRSWRVHKVWEALIGRGLAERGANVSVVICDGLPRCDMFQFETPGYSAVHCRACQAYTNQIFTLGGLPVDNLSSYLQPTERVDARRLVSEWRGDYGSFAAEGLALGDLVRPSLMRTLLRGTLDLRDELTQRLYREYLVGSILLARALRRILDAFQPDTLMLLNGTFFAERIAMAIAAERTLDTVTHERGFMRNRIVFDRDRPANLFRVDETWITVKDRQLTATQEAELDTYLQSRQAGKNEMVNYWPTVEARHDYIVQQLRLDPAKPILSLYTNILWDTAVYQRDRAFDGMFDWLEHTIDQVAALQDLQLVIRIHPAEVRLRQKTRERAADRLAARYPTLPANIAVVPTDSDISSYALTELSTAVGVYTSTIGLEAALRGTPVLVAGETHYREKGFTHDVATREQYNRLIGEVALWKPSPGNQSYRLSPEQIALARRYAYLFFQQNMLPFDLTTEAVNGSIRLNFDTFDTLRPGRNALLDHICCAILEHKEFPLV